MMQGSRERVLREAEFSPRVVSYHAWAAAITGVLTVVFVLILPIAVPAICQWR